MTLLVMVLTTMTAWADALNGTCGKTVDDDVYWEYDVSENTLIIYGTGDMADYSDPGDQPWSSYCNDITTIVIEGDVTSIGDNAFSSVPQNAKVYVLPPTPPTLGNNAFGSKSVTFYVHGNAYSSADGWTNLTKTIIYGVYFRAGKHFSGTPVVSHNGTDYYEAGATLTLDDGTNYVVTKDEDDSVVTDDVLSSSTLTVPAYDITVMAISGNCGASGNNVTWAYNSKVLTISGTGAMADYTEDTEQPWYGYQYDIEEIIIGDYVTHIGDYAFACFYNGNQPLSVTIPSNVKSIGKYAFNNCCDLTSITIPSSVTTIGENAFNGCMGLTSITLEEGLTTINNYAFLNCSSLTSITIPSTVTTIGEGAFEQCSSLASVTILAKSLTTHGSDPFSETAAGLEIYVPATSVDTYKSYWPDYENNFKGLYTVTLSSLPDGVTGVASANLAVAGETVTLSFSGIPAGKAPAVSGTYNSANYGQCYLIITDNGDGTFSFDMGDGPATITVELKNDIATCYVDVPDQVVSPTGYSFINISAKFDYAKEFYDSYAAELIPEMDVEVKDGNTVLALGIDYTYGSVTYANGDPITTSAIGDECKVEIVGLGNYAGSKWANFKIRNPGGEWGDLTWNLNNAGAFTITGTGAMDAAVDNSKYPWYKYCNNFTSITIGEGITSIAASAFAGTQNVRPYGGVDHITLPSSLTTIGANAFAFCTHSDLEITVPTSVVSVGEGAFNSVASVKATLSDAVEDNTTFVRALAGATTSNVSFSRTFTENVASTICLPFAVNSSQVTAAGTFYGFVGVNKTGTEWVVTMQEPSAAPLTANTPYLLMPGTSNPVTFSGDVESYSDLKTTAKATDDNGDEVPGYQWQFKGTYQWITWNSDPGNIYGFAASAKNQGEGSANQDQVAAGEFVQAIAGASVRSFRAYLEYATTSTARSSEARTKGTGIETLPEYMTVRLIGKNGDVDAIGEISLSTGEVTFDSNDWYDLSGRRHAEKPTQRGFYIHKGKKVALH